MTSIYIFFVITLLIIKISIKNLTITFASKYCSIDSRLKVKYLLLRILFIKNVMTLHNEEEKQE